MRQGIKLTCITSTASALCRYSMAALLTVSRVTLNAGIPCVHEAFYFDMVYLGKNVLMGSGWYD